MGSLSKTDTTLSRWWPCLPCLHAIDRIVLASNPEYPLFLRLVGDVSFMFNLNIIQFIRNADSSTSAGENDKPATTGGITFCTDRQI